MKIPRSAAASLVAFLAALLLAGCARAPGTATTMPLTAEARLELAYKTVAIVRNTAAELLRGGHINLEDADNVQAQADTARAGLDIARKALEGNIVAGEAKLEAAETALQALQTYLRTRAGT